MLDPANFPRHRVKYETGALELWAPIMCSHIKLGNGQGAGFEQVVRLPNIRNPQKNGGRPSICLMAGGSIMTGASAATCSSVPGLGLQPVIWPWAGSGSPGAVLLRWPSAEPV